MTSRETLEQAGLDHATGDALVWAVTEPLHRRGILTYHMTPQPWPVRVSAGPATLTFSLALRAPESDLGRVLGMGGAIRQYAARALGIPDSDEGFRVRVREGTQSVLVELPHPRPWHPTFSELEELAADALLLGVDQFNQIAHLDLWTTPPGMLVSGRPGSGKTNAMRLLVAQAMHAGWQVWLIALKGVRAGHDSSEWEDLAPRCHIVAQSHEETEQLLAALDAECEARAAGRTPTEPGLLLVVDELMEVQADHQKALGRLVRLRRSAGLRILAGAQVVGKDISHDIRACLTTRLAGLAASQTESDMATGTPGLGAEHLQGRGDFLLVRDGSRVTRLIVAKADTDDMAQLLRTVPEQVRATPTVAVPRVPMGSAPPRPASPLSPYGQVLARWAQEAEAAGNGATPPPPWLLARAIRYSQQSDKLPSFGLLREWHVSRLGSALSDRRARDVRAAVTELTGIE